jgi:hypothetical protein
VQKVLLSISRTSNSRTIRGCVRDYNGDEMLRRTGRDRRRENAERERERERE